MAQPKPAPTAGAIGGNGGSLSPGVATLLHGKYGPINAEQQSGVDSRTRLTPAGHRLVQGSLFAADALLVGLAARLAFHSGGGFGVLEIALCTLALTTGAWLSCLAIWFE